MMPKIEAEARRFGRAPLSAERHPAISRHARRVYALDHRHLVGGGRL